MRDRRPSQNLLVTVGNKDLFFNQFILEANIQIKNFCGMQTEFYTKFY